MKSIFQTLFIAATVGLLFTSSANSNNITNFASDDIKMNTAIKNARASFYDFMKFVQENKVSADLFGAKVGLKTVAGSEAEVEHIWVNNLRQLNASEFTAQLNNDPRALGDMKYGDEIKFKLENVSDWFVFDGPQAYGYFTLRVFIKQLPRKDRKQYSKILKPKPLPKNW